MAQSKEERISQLYTALEDPGLDGAAARLYMSEYLYLTGNHGDDGAWLFLTQDQVAAIRDQLRNRERFNSLKTFVFYGIVIGVALVITEAYMNRAAKEQTRLEYILDPIRVESYTSEQFQAAIVEASVIVAHQAFPDLSSGELVELQAEIQKEAE